MRRSILLYIAVILFSYGQIIFSQDALNKGLNAITTDAVKAQLEFLSSDWMQGRETGTKGNFLAGDYIASMFKLYGIKPAGDDAWTEITMQDRMKGKREEKYKSYFQNFNLIEYEPGDEQQFAIITNDKENKKSITLAYKSDYSLYPASVGTELDAPVVFVGYGYRNEKQGYNDFDGIDVKGKFIIRMSGYPGHRDTSSEAYKKFKPENDRRWYFNREKNKVAKELGAAGIIEVVKTDFTDWAANVPYRINTPHYEGDVPLRPERKQMDLPGDTLQQYLPTIYLSTRAANEIIKGTDINFSTFDKYAQENMKPASKVIKGKTIHLVTTVKSRLVSVRNIVGMIEGENTEESIVIGGHYDHVGEVNGYIFNGSDDNASGTVGVMTIAKAFAESGIKPNKTIIFAAWTGEEKGLLGSYYYADHPVKPIDKMIANLNYDMISRDDEKDSAGVNCSMTYTKAYKQLQDMTEKYNTELGLGLNISFEPEEKPGGGSDHTPFADKKVPIFYFMAGFHPDYHQVTDHANKANISKMTNIIKLGFRNVWELANSDSGLTALK